MMRRRMFLGAMLALVGSPAVHAQDTPGEANSAHAQLQHFVEHVAAATGRYSQTTVSPAADAADPARPPQTGTFAFARPGRFKWAAETPYEQLVLADGSQVFQYDPDLAQVTIRPLNDAIGASPAAILFGSGALAEHFDITALPHTNDGLAWLRAIPRAADAGFSQVDIALNNNLPARIELLDAFGQTTTITLTAVTSSPNLPAETFQFTPPDGVDVVRM